MNLWALDSADLMQVLNCPKKRILFKVSNRLYLKLNKGCEQASAIWRACKHPKKLTSERASRKDNMADRTIYRLTEYNLNNELIKTVYHNHRERAEEEKNNNENESQYIEELSFDANDMNDLCDRLNSDVIED